MIILKNNSLIALLFIISSWALIACEENGGSCLSAPKIVLGKRPECVQATVDKAFEHCQRYTEKSWLYNGNDNYYLFDLDEAEVIKNIALEHDGDIYVVDVGCGRGHWGRSLMRTILSLDEKNRNSKKHFHIFSVTGGNECDELVQTEGNVTLYQFNNFKIENIDEEFIKRGYDLKNKVHLIVSKWTLRHLVDPWGTLKRMYNLLMPRQGLLVSNGFLFAFNDSDKVQSFPISYEPDTPNWNILMSANAIPLFRFYDVGRDLGEFLLMRNNGLELELPLEYTGEIREITGEHQCESSVITVFKKRALSAAQSILRLKRADQQEEIIQEDGLLNENDFSKRYRAFCDQNNQASRRLYTYLQEQRLFSSYLA